MVSEHDSASYAAILTLFFNQGLFGLIFSKKIGVGVQ